MHLLGEAGGEDKLFAKLLMREMSNNFSGFKDEYGAFLKENGIHDKTFHGEKEITKEDETPEKVKEGEKTEQEQPKAEESEVIKIED